MNAHKECGFAPIVCTGVESFLTVAAGNPESAFAADEKYVSEIKASGSDLDLCLLLSHRDAGNGVYKYSSVETVVRDMETWFGRMEPHEPDTAAVAEEHREKGVRIITYLATGNAYRSGLCALDDATGRVGESVLFLSFDPYFTEAGMECPAADMSISDMLFYLREGAAGEGLLLDALKQSEGRADLIYGVNSWTDIYDMTVDDMTSLLELLQRTQYEVVVADMSVLGSPGLVLMEQSEKVVVLLDVTEGSKEREQEWEAQMRRLGAAVILDRTQVTRISASGYQDEPPVSGRAAKTRTAVPRIRREGDRDLR